MSTTKLRLVDPFRTVDLRVGDVIDLPTGDLQCSMRPHRITGWNEVEMDAEDLYDSDDATGTVLVRCPTVEPLEDPPEAA